MADVITMPKLGFDMAEGVLIRWAKAEGEQIEKGELIAEIETDKATVEVESQFSGTVRKQLVSEGAVVPVNTPIAVIGAPDEQIDVAALTGGAALAPASEPEPEAAQPIGQPQSVPATELEADTQLPDGLRASPLARRMAEEQGIDLRSLVGSGPGGRIVKQDLEQAIKAVPVPQPARLALPTPQVIQLGGEDRRVPLSKLRQIIGRRMVESKQNFPSFYVTRDYDIGRVMELRQQANAALAESDEKLSVNDFVLKATALALRRFPNLNSALDGDSVIQFGHVNVGVAVAVENGLLTVVCHDTDLKSLRQISREVKEKANRARTGKVQSDDVSGSTFSVSNLGMFDVENFTAIINPPEAAILAIGSARQVPVATEGGLSVGWRMKATISVDHRVSDGVEAARFMQALAEYLENPVSLML